MITSKKLSKYNKINHGFFNRIGGKSKGIYSTLNCGYGSKDKKVNIKKNLKIVKNRISKNSKNVFLMNQTHSNKVFFIDKKLKFLKKISADAVVTGQSKIPIATLTADCVPILIYERKKNIIAAIHAGWKGALKGIVKKVITLMINKGCKRKYFTVAIGPCIQEKNYEVKKDFFNKFVKKYEKSKIFFKKKKSKLYFNLPNFLKYQLKINKITNIDTIKIDTFDKKNNFFSARRSLQLKHDDYGRNISIIMIN